MAQTECEQLLAELLNRLDVTWGSDEATVAKINGILDRCMDGLRSRSGNPNLQFVGEVKSLLFDYCRYDLNNCREEFDAAFAGELTMLRLMEGYGCGKQTTQDADI